MSRGLLTEEEFNRVVSARARQERPDLRIRIMGKSFLLVDQSHGHRRLIPLFDLYQLYCEFPMERDELISHFLSSRVYDEPVRITGGFEENKTKVLPQVVPPSLLEFCRQDNRDLAAVEYVGGLAVAFVLDEPDRYAYLHRSQMERWGTNEGELLKTAVQNLEMLNQDAPPYHMVMREKRLTLVWETFDGYDASRILLTGQLQEAATKVAGNPVIAIPHRDYMALFGDAEPEYVAEMADRVREAFESHGYPITPQLFTMRNGGLEVYAIAQRHVRLLN